MSMQKKLLTRGLLMLISFFVVLAVIFSPVFPGKVNGLDYMDNLFNMISKGSSDFTPKISEEIGMYENISINVTFAMKSEEQAKKTAMLFEAGGAEVQVDSSKLSVKGDMGQVLLNSLRDAKTLFQNDADQLAQKYGYSGRQVLFNWWEASNGIIPDLNKQKKFKEAKMFATLQKKAYEPAYNYYGVEASNYKDNFILIIAALVFYVIYTLWYGFGIMYLFEGMGMQIAH